MLLITSLISNSILEDSALARWRWENQSLPTYEPIVFNVVLLFSLWKKMWYRLKVFQYEFGHIAALLICNKSKQTLCQHQGRISRKMDLSEATVFDSLTCRAVALKADVASSTSSSSDDCDSCHGNTMVFCDKRNAWLPSRSSST